jgi:hypothetical protein
MLTLAKPRFLSLDLEKQFLTLAENFESALYVAATERAFSVPNGDELMGTFVAKAVMTAWDNSSFSNTILAHHAFWFG